MDHVPKFSTALIALLLLFVLQGPVALLQIVAWGGMLLDHSQEGSVVVAIEKTFNGKNPCSLCLTVQEIQGQQTNDGLLEKQGRPLLLLLGQARTQNLNIHKANQALHRNPAEPTPASAFRQRTTPPPKCAALAAA